MPKTDVIDERSLSRLQGIDLREHGDQNTADDCANLRLDNASRMVPFPRPDKFASYTQAGGYTFACESKSPSTSEFDLHLAEYEGAPSVTSQEAYASGDLTKVRLKGSCLVNNCTVIVYDGSQNCLVSGHDFGTSTEGSDLVLDMKVAEFGMFTRMSVSNVHGATDIAIDITERNNNVVDFCNAFRMGIDPITLELCIWANDGNGKFEKVQSWYSESAQPWVESANNYVTGIGKMMFGTNSQFFFEAANLSPNPSVLGLAVGSTAYQTWDCGFVLPSSGSTLPASNYTFGKYRTYRFRLGQNDSLVLEMKSDSSTNNYDITLQEWTI